MRASRLVNVLLLLQTRGRMTAAQLAGELEVSERTIHRDVEALSAAGIPVYAERGPHGGVQLVEGYRTRLTGMTAEEAEALFLSGLAGPAAELGLGTVIAAAQLKVLAALPPELRSRASRLVERFHLDAAGWFQRPEELDELAGVAAAVWSEQQIWIAYDRGDRLVERLVDPLGLVLKSGTWYLVGRADGQIRTYRVSRIRHVGPADGSFARPDGFDLAAHWRESIAAYERDASRTEVSVRVRPERVGDLFDIVGDELAEAEAVDQPDPDGWRRFSLRLVWGNEAVGRLLGLGEDLEVLEPIALRERAVALARGVLRRHESQASAEVSRPGPRAASRRTPPAGRPIRTRRPGTRRGGSGR